MADIFD